MLRVSAEILGNCGRKTCIIIERTKMLKVKLGLIVKHSTLFVLKKNHNEIKKLTNLNPLPTSPDQQLAMTLYRFAIECTYLTLPNFFDVSVLATNKFFKVVCRSWVAI